MHGVANHGILMRVTVRAAVAGATGYAGGELLRLLPLRILRWRSGP